MSFGLLSLGLVFMAGLAMASCAQHSLNAWRSGEWDDRIYAVGALSLTAAILLALAYNNAPDADSYRRYYQWHAVLSRPFFFAWAYFVLRFAGFSAPWVYRVWLGAEAVKAALLLIFIRTPYFFDIQSIGRAPQPWGETVAYPIGQGLPLQFIQVLLPLLGLGFTLAGSVRLIRKRQFLKAAFLGLTVSLSVGTVLYDNLADWLRWPDVAVAEFMVAVPVLFLGWASSDRLVQAMLTRRRLHESEGQVLDLRGQVARAQQMRLLGELAAGLAHDLRNMLASIRLATAALRPGVGESQADLDHIDAACDRAADLTRRLLALGRSADVQPKALAAAAVLESTARLLKPSLPAGLRLDVQPGEPGLQAWGDASLLESALLNLGLNARDASPKGSAVTLSAQAQSAEDGRPGVLFEVRDQGPGMDAEQQARLFQPFFSTKTAGGGTGLGLMMVQYAAETMGGRASVASSPGAGSCFRLWLPSAVPERSAPSPKLAPGLEILVLDDEAIIAVGLQRLLQRAGHQALAVNDPYEALDLLGRQPGRFALLITDMNMPGLNGHEVLREARKLDPGLKVILSSGSTAQSEDNGGFDAWLEKPYSIEQLLDAIARVVQR